MPINKGVSYVALYERLSRDDELQGESNSITNQKEMLESYAKANGFTPFRHFSDDGISGTTFERDGFKEMISECEKGNVSAVIVKDLSQDRQIRTITVRICLFFIRESRISEWSSQLSIKISITALSAVIADAFITASTFPLSAAPSRARRRYR